MKFNRLLFPGLILMGQLAYISCRKVDRQPDETSTSITESKFFTNHASTNPLVQAITRFTKGQNNKYRFVDKLVKQIGYPYWDKATTVASGASSRGASDSNYITFIPFVRDTQNYVNATLEVATSPTDTTFRIMCDWQYNDSLLTGLSPKKFALTMMLQDNAVFGNRRFKLLDSTIFNSNVGYVKLNPPSGSGRNSPQTGVAGRTSTVTTLVCWTEWIPAFQGQVVGCAPEDPCFQWVPQYVCIEITWNPPGGGGGGGTGGGTGTGTGGTGTGTGGGGYTGGGWVPPPCPGGVAARGATYENCTPAWVPPPSPPPCDTYIGLLQNDATFKQKFMSLNGTAATGSSVEKGFAVFDRVSGNYVAKEGLQHQPFIKWGDVITPGTLIDGLLHSHFQGYNNIFSPDDILLMAEIFVNGYAKDPNNLFFGMTSNTGLPYLIKVSNPTKFMIFAQKILAMQAKNEGFTWTYENKLNSGDNTKNLKEFFKMLQKYGGLAGLAVYEAVPDNTTSYNFDQWKKLNWDGFDDFGPSTNCF